MLRHTIQSVAKRHVVRRSYAAATSAKKRALAKSQVAGTGAADGSAPSKAEAATPPPPAAAAPPPPPASSSEASTMIPVAILGVAAAGGAAYYLDLLPRLNQPEIVGEEVVVVEEKEVAVTAEEQPKEAPKKEETAAASTVAKDDATVSKEPAKKEAGTKTGSRVTTVQIPTKTGPPAKVSAPKAHPAQGNRVAMTPPPSKEASAAEAAKELEAANLEETSATLAKAHQTLRADFDQSLFADLDSLSNEQLKIRVVQLATEMEERTKWEAVRLKEFLAMKEKETGEK